MDPIYLPESISATGTGCLIYDVVWQHGRQAGGHSGMFLHDFDRIHHDFNGVDGRMFVMTRCTV